MKKLILGLFFASTLVSCTQKVAPPQEITVNEQFTIQIPSNLAVMPDLYPDAVMQYGNTFNQVYIIGREVEKTQDSTFQAFVNASLATYAKRPNYKIIKEQNVLINGTPAKIFDLTMTQNNSEMFMTQVMLNGKKANYELIGWTIGKNQQYQGEQLLDIISTFKEI